MGEKTQLANISFVAIIRSLTNGSIALSLQFRITSLTIIMVLFAFKNDPSGKYIMYRLERIKIRKYFQLKRLSNIQLTSTVAM